MVMLIKGIVTANRLAPNLAGGTVDLPLTVAREVSTRTILDATTTPVLSYNLSAFRLSWAPSNVDEISWQVTAPPDFDPAQNLILHLLVSCSASVDDPVIVVRFYEGMNNNNRGGNTSAITLGSINVEKSFTIAGGTLAGNSQWTIYVVPSQHDSDTVRLDGAWLTYKRK